MHSSADANRHGCVASTWPLAYELNLHLLGYDPLPVNRLLMWIHVPYVMAIITYALSKRMYHIEAAVVIADQNFGDTFSFRADCRLCQEVLSLAAEVRSRQVGGEG
jgi:hypothetical protein